MRISLQSNITRRKANITVAPALQQVQQADLLISVLKKIGTVGKVKMLCEVLELFV